MNSNQDKRKADGIEYKESMLASLYEEYYDKIAGYAFVRIGNKAEAEDIAGEVFLKALKSLKSYKERGVPMQAWLFRIAHNLVIDYFRKNKKHMTVPIDEMQIEIFGSKIDPQHAQKNKKFHHNRQNFIDFPPCRDVCPSGGGSRSSHSIPACQGEHIL